MSFMPVVPAQLESVRYLDTVLPRLRGRRG
jgi:hypothetical protein